MLHKCTYLTRTCVSKQRPSTKLRANTYIAIQQYSKDIPPKLEAKDSALVTCYVFAFACWFLLMQNKNK